VARCTSWGDSRPLPIASSRGTLAGRRDPSTRGGARRTPRMYSPPRNKETPFSSEAPNFLGATWSSRVRSSFPTILLSRPSLFRLFPKNSPFWESRGVLKRLRTRGSNLLFEDFLLIRGTVVATKRSRCPEARVPSWVFAGASREAGRSLGLREMVARREGAGVRALADPGAPWSWHDFAGWERRGRAQKEGQVDSEAWSKPIAFPTHVAPHLGKL